MSEGTAVDPERLRSELDLITEAMGLRERYPSQFQYWPVFGLLVVLASAGSQFVLVGVTSLVVGETLRAYYVRRRDRLAFYIGGLWMLVLAVLLTQVEVLHTRGCAAFGIVDRVHAAASYPALR